MRRFSAAMQLFTSVALVLAVTLSATAAPRPIPGRGPAIFQHLLRNNAPHSVKVFWIDARGREVLYSTFQPGQSGTIRTPIGHRWVIRHFDTGALIQRFTGNGGGANINIIGLPPAPPPPPKGTAVVLTFDNLTPDSVEYFWVTPAGTEKSYGVLNSGEARPQNTFRGHQWVARDQKSGNELVRVTATADAEVDITAPTPPTPASKQVTLTFINQTKAQVALIWLNPLSQEKSYGTINAGVSKKMLTGIGQTWIVRDPGTGHELLRITATATADVPIQDNPSPVPPSPPPPPVIVQGTMTPIDPTSVERGPSIMPFVNPNDNLDIAWLRNDGKTMVSSFAVSKGYGATAHREVNGAMTNLGGFTKDKSGNFYLLTLTAEQAAGGIKTVRPGIANLLQFPRTATRWTVLADLNSGNYIPAPMAGNPARAVVNPLVDVQGNRGTARLTFANGALFPIFTQNWGWDGSIYHQRAQLFGVGLDGKNVYGNGGYWGHCADLRMLVDGNSLIVAQANEKGISIFTLATASDGTLKWGGNHLVLNNNGNNNSRLRLAGLGKTSTGYLLGYTYGPDGFMWEPTGHEHPSRDDVYMMTIPQSVLGDVNTAGPIMDVTTVPANVSTKRLVNYTNTGKTTARRLSMVDMQDGKYLLMWEQWTVTTWLGGSTWAPNWGAFSATWAMVVDAKGNQVVAPKSLGNVRIQKESDAFFLPTSKLAGWAVGDAANNRLLLNTLDESLNLQTTPLILQ